MTAIVFVAVYAGALIFVAGCIRRVVQYARTPIHLRWELYPVPHEEPSRVAHGGSYFEEDNWWTRPQHFSLSGELAAMIPEMLFLKALWEFNRRLWYASFLFHFGLYLVIGSALLLAITAAFGLLVPGATGLAAVLTFLSHVAGWAGAILVLVGATALLVRRLTSAELKNSAAPADIGNLIFFLVTFAVLIVGLELQPPGAGLRTVVRGLLTFQTGTPMGGVFAAGVVMASALAAYIPFTHMSHFIAKYFTYHEVRWDDRVNRRGGDIEAKLLPYFGYRPTWAAAHMHADGKKTWAEIVAINPAAEVKK